MDTRAVGVGKGRSIAYETVYQTLYAAIIPGCYDPGRAPTIRGIADGMVISPMPVREAVHRPVSLWALSMHSIRPVSVSSVCAIRRMRQEKINRVYLIEKELDQSIRDGDAQRHAYKNREFHLTPDSGSDAQGFLGLAESPWLCFGYFVRTGVGRIANSLVAGRCRDILAALEVRNVDALREAVRLDIYGAMEKVGFELFGTDARS